MTSKFSISHPPIKPPSICKSLILELPPALPIEGPLELQGYAAWTDLDPDFPISGAVYITMPRENTSWSWSGTGVDVHLKIGLTLTRLADPQPWELTIEKWYNGLGHEVYTWPTFELDTTGCWNTGLLTQITLPGIDYRSAQVML